MYLYMFTCSHKDLCSMTNSLTILTGINLKSIMLNKNQMQNLDNLIPILQSSKPREKNQATHISGMHRL